MLSLVLWTVLHGTMSVVRGPCGSPPSFLLVRGDTSAVPRSIEGAP